METCHFRDLLMGLLIGEGFVVGSARDEVLSCTGRTPRGSRLSVVVVIKEALVIIIVAKKTSRGRTDNTVKIERKLDDELLIEVMNLICG